MTGVLRRLAPLLILGLLSGCAPGPDPATGVPDAGGDVAGFWQGLWHGFIALFTFVVSLFSDGVRMYEVHNTGVLYDLGFLIGITAFFGGGGETGRRSRRR
jgi:hypothetical protein